MELIPNILTSIIGLFVGAFVGSYLRRLQTDKHWTVLDEAQWWKEFLNL